MSPRQYSAPSVRQLAAVVAELEPSVSGGRLRQLQMVVGMWDRAVNLDTMPVRARRTVRQLFTPPALDAFWAAASSGLLRTPNRPGLGHPLPLASLRIVRDCLAMLGRQVLPEDNDFWLPSVPQQEPKATVSPGAVVALYRGLVDMAAQGPLERDGTAMTFEARTRLLAMVAVVLDTGARSGELAALRLDDLAEGGRVVGVRRQPQKAPPNRAEEIGALARVHPQTVRMVLWGQVGEQSEATRQRVLAAVRELGPLPEVEWYPLREGTGVALQRWLKVREGVVAGLPDEPARRGLWVALVPTVLGPPGLPLQAQGVRSAFTRGMTALNWLMADEHGWEPMPTRMEQLRRSVDPVPLEVPPAGQVPGMVS